MNMNTNPRIPSEEWEPGKLRYTQYNWNHNGYEEVFWRSNKDN